MSSLQKFRLLHVLLAFGPVGQKSNAPGHDLSNLPPYHSFYFYCYSNFQFKIEPCVVCVSPVVHMESADRYFHITSTVLETEANVCFFCVSMFISFFLFGADCSRKITMAGMPCQKKKKKKKKKGKADLTTVLHIRELPHLHMKLAVWFSFPTTNNKNPMIPSWSLVSIYNYSFNPDQIFTKNFEILELDICSKLFTCDMIFLQVNSSLPTRLKRYVLSH